MREVSIRPAVRDDAEAIAKVHVNAWRQTYRGLVPKAFLDGLSVKHRAMRWRRALEGLPSEDKVIVFVATVPNDGVVGFGSHGRQRDSDLEAAGFDGEFQAIYLLNEAKRLGAGRGLMQTMAISMLDRGHKGAALWVLRGNHPARCFYEALGGEIMGEREERRSDDLVFDEVAYGWLDLGALV